MPQWQRHNTQHTLAHKLALQALKDVDGEEQVGHLLMGLQRAPEVLFEGEEAAEKRGEFFGGGGLEALPCSNTWGGIMIINIYI